MNRAKTSGNIEKQGMVKLFENEFTTKDGLEFCPYGQGTNCKFEPARGKRKNNGVKNFRLPNQKKSKWTEQRPLEKLM